jgi:hypothetical protein
LEQENQRPFGVHTPKDLEIIWLSNLVTEHIWLRLFQKHVEHTKLDINVFNSASHMDILVLSLRNISSKWVFKNELFIRSWVNDWRSTSIYMQGIFSNLFLFSKIFFCIYQTFQNWETEILIVFLCKRYLLYHTRAPITSLIDHSYLDTISYIFKKSPTVLTWKWEVLTISFRRRH